MAVRNPSAQILLKVNEKALTQGMRNATQAMRKATTGMQSLANSTKNIEAKLTELSREMRRMSTEQARSAREAEKNRKGLLNLARAVGRGGALNQGLKGVNSGLTRVAAGAAKSTAAVRANTAAMRQHAAAANTYGAALGTYASGIGKIHGKFLLWSGSLATAFFLISRLTRTAREMNTQFTRTQYLVGISAAEMDKFRGAVFSISNATGRPLNELAEGLFDVTSAGLRGGEAMAALETAAKAAVLGLGTTKTAADAITNSMGAFGISAQRVAAILALTVRLGKALPDELVPAFARVGSIAATLGIEMEEIGAALAVLTRTQSAEQAATRLQGVLATLIKPSAQAADTLARFGLTTQQLRDAFSRSLIEGLTLLKRSIPTAELGKLFRNVQGLGALLSIIGPQFKDFREITQQFQTGDIVQAFEEDVEGASRSLENALARIGRVLTNWAHVLMESLLTPLANVLADVLEAIEGLPTLVASAVHEIEKLTPPRPPIRDVPGVTLRRPGRDRFTADWDERRRILAGLARPYIDRPFFHPVSNVSTDLHRLRQPGHAAFFHGRQGFGVQQQRIAAGVLAAEEQYGKMEASLREQATLWERQARAIHTGVRAGRELLTVDRLRTDVLAKADAKSAEAEAAFDRLYARVSPGGPFVVQGDERHELHEQALAAEFTAQALRNLALDMARLTVLTNDYNASLRRLSAAEAVDQLRKLRESFQGSLDSGRLSTASHFDSIRGEIWKYSRAAARGLSDVGDLPTVDVQRIEHRGRLADLLRQQAALEERIDAATGRTADNLDLQLHRVLGAVQAERERGAAIEANEALYNELDAWQAEFDRRAKAAKQNNHLADLMKAYLDALHAGRQRGREFFSDLRRQIAELELALSLGLDSPGDLSSYDRARIANLHAMENIWGEIAALQERLRTASGEHREQLELQLQAALGTLTALNEQGIAIENNIDMMERLDELTKAFERADSLHKRNVESLADTINNSLVDSIVNFAAGVSSASDAMKGLIRDIAAAVLRAQLLAAFGINGSDTGPGGWLLRALPGLAGPQLPAPAGQRAFGGPVIPGQPYITGERGRELFVADRPGRILPHGEGGGVTLNQTINIPPGADEGTIRRVADEVRPGLAKEAEMGVLNALRRSGRARQMVLGG